MPTMLLDNVDALRNLPWPDARGGNPFVSRAFCLEWLAQHRREATPFVIASFDDSDRLVALAPWCRVRDRLGVRRVTGIGGHDAWFHDPWLSESVTPEDAAREIAGCLRGRRREWDLLELTLRPEASASWLSHFQPLGWSLQDQPLCQEHAMLEFPSGYEEFFDRHSKESRSKLRRSARKLEEVPHRYCDETQADPESLLAEMFRLHAERWAHACPDWQPYHQSIRAMALEAHQHGRMLLNVLMVGERFAALDLLIVAGQIGHYLIKVYDPDFSQLSVGNLLTMRTLERACQYGVTQVDCGPGPNEWKRRLDNRPSQPLVAHVVRKACFAGVTVQSWDGLVAPRLRRYQAEHPAVRLAIQFFSALKQKAQLNLGSGTDHGGRALGRTLAAMRARWGVGTALRRARLGRLDGA